MDSKSKKCKAVRHGKMLSMKTATDVIHRILWDACVPQDLMTIGYLDRFIGVVEKPFNDFSWEPLETLDYFTFGVPKHRIQYFKYKNAVVWDKRTRLDNFFGSLGSGKTIDLIIKEYKDEDYAEAQKAPLGGVEKFDVCSSFSNSDASSDDGLDLHLAPNAHTLSPLEVEDTESAFKSKKITGQRKIYESVELPSDPENITMDGLDEPWQNKLRPNYFICQRIVSKTFCETAKSIQDRFCDMEELYKSCCYDSKLFHVTLATLRLDTEEQITECVKFLSSVREELSDLRPTSPISIKGVSCFNGRVLYAVVKESEELSYFVDHLELLLRSSGFLLPDGRDFVPHATLLKVNRAVSRRVGPRSIKPNMYAEFSEAEFGEFAIEELDLCLMGKQRNPDGFYSCPGSISML